MRQEAACHKYYEKGVTSAKYDQITEPQQNRTVQQIADLTLYLVFDTTTVGLTHTVYWDAEDCNIKSNTVSLNNGCLGLG